MRNRRSRRQERVTVVSTKKSEQFQGCRLRIDLFVSRVPKDYPTQHIKDMIADTGVEILDLILLSHENATMASYKDSIWKDDEERLMKPDAWPQCISYRRYVRPRRRNDDHRHWETGTTHTATMATVYSPNVNSLWPHLDLRRTTFVVFPS